MPTRVLRAGEWKVTRVGIIVWCWAAVASLGCGARAAGRPFAVTGLGGAGAMYTPMVSPFDPNLMLLSCDMSGCYRSEDGGGHWELIHTREMSSGTGCRPFFLRGAILWATGPALKISRDKGATWQPLLAGEAPWGTAPVTRLSGNPGRPEQLLVGTDTGLW